MALSQPVPAVASGGAEEPRYWGPQWSPTGEWLLVAGYGAPNEAVKHPGPVSLSWSPADAFRPREITSAGFPAGTMDPRGVASWSPDGKQIAYQGVPSAIVLTGRRDQ